MDYIPKGILTKIINKYFTFLWTKTKKKEGIPLVKRPHIEQQKGRMLQKFLIFNTSNINLNYGESVKYCIHIHNKWQY